jgi:taurine dioxygenase
MKVQPLTGTLGAEISNIDLKQPLTKEQSNEIISTILKYRVIFFRQQFLSPTDEVTFAKIFGKLTPAHPLQGGLDADHPEILVLDSKAYKLGVGQRGDGTSYNNRYHTDVTFLEAPAAYTVLASVELPQRGGDTIWVDQTDLYNSLSPGLQNYLEKLYAIHDGSRAFPAGIGLTLKEPVRHPVIRIHPETGEKCVFVNSVFTQSIEGVSEYESDGILRLLFSMAALPDRQVRWKWTTGDVVVWDNRNTSHYAVADYTERRVMYRITVEGSKPFGPQDIKK